MEERHEYASKKIGKTVKIWCTKEKIHMDNENISYFLEFNLCVCVCLAMSDYLQPHGLHPTRLLCPWGFSRQEYWSGLPCPPPGDLPNPGIDPRSPALQVASLPSEPPGKPKNTGVGSLSLLQGIFPTQELNRHLLNCKQILYQLSYQWNNPGL